MSRHLNADYFKFPAISEDFLQKRSINLHNRSGSKVWDQTEPINVNIFRWLFQLFLTTTYLLSLPDYWIKNWNSIICERMKTVEGTGRPVLCELECIIQRLLKSLYVLNVNKLHETKSPFSYQFPALRMATHPPSH